jgi:hypothetical protein
MSDSRGSIFHRAVEGMVAGGSLTRENVEQLRRAGATYQMILKEAENLGIISETDYDEIADAAEDELRRRAPGQITEAADILYLIRMGVIDSDEGVEILVRNNTLRQDIVDDLLEDGSSYEQILEDLAATQAARRREQRGGGRTRRKRGSCKI